MLSAGDVWYILVERKPFVNVLLAYSYLKKVGMTLN